MEEKLREILARVFNLEAPGAIRMTDSLIADLGADSLDFVEILHLIERTFGVVIRTSEILSGGADVPEKELFVDGALSPRGAEILRATFAGKRSEFREGMTKVDLFSLLTVGDLAAIVRSKMDAGAAHA